MPTLGAMLLQQVNQQHGQELARVAGRLGATQDNLLHLVLDPNFDPAGYDGLSEILLDLVKNPLPVASCYPTAEALFPIIADDANGQHGGSAPKQSFNAEGPFQTAVAGLVQAINQADQGGHDTVFRVEYGGHGFTLVVRKPGPQDAPHVELIETVANDAIIMPSLRHAPYTPGQVTTALTHMADSTMQTRKDGADVFGWSATDFWLAEKTGSDPVFPNVGFRWWSGALRPDALARWTANFATRLATLDAAKQ